MPSAHAALESVSVDRRDADACAALVGRVRPDQIFHLASLVSGRRSLSLVAETFRANLASTVQLMDAAEQCGTRRFITAGSLEEPEAGTAPSSPYAASKAVTRLYAELFADTGRIKVVHAQLAMIYGPGQRDVTKLVPSVIHALLGWRVPEVSSGTRLADWTSIDDIVEALLRIACADAALPATVQVGTGTLRSVRHVVESLVDVSGKAVSIAFGAVADRANEPAPTADLAALGTAFGWVPSIALPTGLQRTWDAARAAHDLAKGTATTRAAPRSAANVTGSRAASRRLVGLK